MSSRHLAPLRVLVVDDEPDTAWAMGNLLDGLGHCAATAPDGHTAIRLARDFAPQLVLCDLCLPGLDGYAVARALRAEPKTARSRLVAITGFSGDAVSRALRSAGFDQHLCKPLNFVRLRALLTEAGAPA